MKALITGGTGFTGSKLARRLYNSGADVRLLVRDEAKVNLSKHFHAEIIKGDIRDPVAVDRAVNGVEQVFNIAAVYRTAAISDRVYWDVHVNGTQNLLNSALKYGISKFIHCSTVGVHGHIEHPPAHEAYPFNPGDIYQQTKLQGEIETIQFTRETGLPVTVIRPCAIYGPGDMRLLKLFRLASRKIVPILGSGDIFYHMVYIDDLVDAFILASKSEEALGEAFIIGGDEILSLKQLTLLIAKELERKPILLHLPAKPFQVMGSLCEKLFIPLRLEPPIYKRRIDFFTKSRAFDIGKAKKLLNYQPKVPLKVGLANSVKWYRSQGLL